MKKNNILTYLYPLLAALYPVIFLYAYNLTEVTFMQVFPYMGFAVLSFLVVFILVKLIMKNIEKTAFITAFFFIWFFSYGFVFDFISSLFFIRQFVLLSIWGIIFAGVFYIVFNCSKKDLFVKAVKPLTTVFALLIFINIVLILPYEFSRNLNSDQKTDQGVIVETDSDSEKYCDNNNCPDIYYIILDEYAGFDSIKEVFDYDDTGFYDFLKENGFSVIEKSIAKSPNTFENLSSNLNMEDLKSTDKIESYKAIRDNKVAAYLKQKGYTTVVFNNSYLPDDMTATADYNLMANKSNQVNSILLVLVNKTVLKPLVPYIQKWSETENRRLFILRNVKNLDYIKGPKFVYVHLVCPHPPFQFDEDGELIDEQYSYNWDDKKYYIGQFIFMTKEIQEVIESLKKKDPIIILQSDHGVRQNHFNELGEMHSYPYIPEKAFENILNVFYLPEFKGTIPQDLKAFDTFKIIFNSYFGDNLEIL